MIRPSLALVLAALMAAAPLAAASAQTPPAPSGGYPAPATSPAGAPPPGPITISGMFVPGAPPAAVQALPFPEALNKVATALLSQLQLPPGNDPVEIVIDPLVDAFTGAQSNATRSIEQQVAALIKEKFPRLVVKPFNAASLARSPIIFMGTFSPAPSNGQIDGPKDSFWICFVLSDLKSGKIASKATGRSKLEGIDNAPTPYFAETPVLAKDPAIDAYIRNCITLRPGDPINPAYLERVVAGAMLAEAIKEYDSRRYREALAFYRTALQVPGGDQLRTHNGVYLANWKLGRRPDASDAFGDLVDFSLNNNRLAMRFLFRPGSTKFYDDPDVTAAYPMWLSQIALRASRRNECLEVVGHTSKTGPAQINERLSVLRAQYIKELIQAGDPRLAERLTTSGMGSNQNLVGTGRDDASDAVDRRVEFKVNKC